MIVFVSISFISCEKEEPDTMNEPPVVEENEFSTMDCDSFFDSGDYSSICGITSSNTDFINSTQGQGQQDNCNYVIETIDGHRYLVIIDFLDTVSDAALNADGMNLGANYNPYNDIDYTFDSVSNLGDKANFVSYVQVVAGNTPLEVSHLELICHKSNALVVMLSDFTLGDPIPCAHSKDEMVKFAREILSNL